MVLTLLLQFSMDFLSAWKLEANVIKWHSRKGNEVVMRKAVYNLEKQNKSSGQYQKLSKGWKERKGLILLEREINNRKEKRFSRNEIDTGDPFFAKVTGRGISGRGWGNDQRGASWKQLSVYSACVFNSFYLASMPTTPLELLYQ